MRVSEFFLKSFSRKSQKFFSGNFLGNFPKNSEFVLWKILFELNKFITVWFTTGYEANAVWYAVIGVGDEMHSCILACPQVKIYLNQITSSNER